MGRVTYLKEIRTHRNFIPSPLIKLAIDEEWTRALSFFVKLKSSCSHGGFPDMKSAEQRTGIPRSVCYRYIKTLKQKGLITKNSNGWFKLQTRSQLEGNYNRYCCTIIHKTNESVTEITRTLKLKIIEEKNLQQQYLIRNFQLIELSKRGALAALKKMCRYGVSYDTVVKRRLEKIKYKELMTSTGFTHSYLAEELNCSISSISHILNKGRKEKWCKTKLLAKPICRMTLEEYNKCNLSLRREYPSLFWERGKAMYKVCTLYKQSSYWEQGNVVLG